MPIDRAKAMAATFPAGKASWGNDDVILYHLGIGAGVPATAPNELAYTYEKNLKVLPSYAVVVKFAPMGDILSMPGLEFNPFMLLHGEQDVEVHNPLPPTAEGVTGQMRIADVYDKSKAAVAILEIHAKDASGTPLFTNRMALWPSCNGCSLVYGEFSSLNSRYFNTNAVTPILLKYSAASCPSAVNTSSLCPPPGHIITAAPLAFSFDGW